MLVLEKRECPCGYLHEDTRNSTFLTVQELQQESTAVGGHSEAAAVANTLSRAKTPMGDLLEQENNPLEASEAAQQGVHPTLYKPSRFRA